MYRWHGMLALWLSLLVGCSGLAPPAPGDEPGQVTARAQSGAVRGRLLPGDVAVFNGIPYAAPPTGALRWQPPEPPLPWPGVRDAFAAGSPCPQSGRLAGTNEDCLTLNVWAPQRAQGRRLPVMVFLHGGGQRESAGHEYNADWLVTRGTPVVFVSLNYRLNIFAFFAHAQLSAENPQMGSGNYATLDQQQALRWVRANIQAFGGDPGNVTVFGESGGAQAVCVLLASPSARGLFHRAISQSGPCQWQHYPSLTASEARGVATAAELGCPQADPLPCLRALPAATVLAKERGAQTDTAGAQPAWGGGAFPLPIREAMASGRFHRVPLMQGSNMDEALFGLTPRFEGRGQPLTAAQYPEQLRQFLGASRVDAVQQQYPLSRYTAPIFALSAALTDSGMVSNNRIGLCNLHLAQQLAAPHVPAYAYVFADRTAPYPLPIFGHAGDLPGAAHTKELSYLFHQSALTPAQRAVSDRMIGHWTRFAATGDPNGPGLPHWPRYEPEKQMAMRYQADQAAADDSLYRAAHCRFWSEQGFSNLSGPYPTPSATGPAYQ